MKKVRRQTSYVSISSSGLPYAKPRPKLRTREELEYYKAEYSTADHLLTLQQLEERYCTSVTNGLTQLRAIDLLDKFGANSLSAPPTRSRWWLVMEFYFCGFAILMWLGVILSTIGAVMSYLNYVDTYEDHLYLACILLLVIIITGTFGFYHESISVGLMEDFQKLLPKFATVIRDGQHFRLPSEELVLGDLVELKPGDWIPADLRLTEANYLKVDNSAITGELTPEVRNTESGDVNPLDATNLVFYSTIVVEGTGKGIVINVGDNTLIGHIAGLTTSISKQQTPLRREINRFIQILTVIAILTGLTFFAICLNYDYNFFVCFSYLIALSIANIPEGLPVTLTACMTLTSKRMASNNCLIKNNEAIETLGCCNVICTDKTGTLTQNRMKVIHLYFDMYNHYIFNNEDEVDLENPSFKQLSLIASLCSNAYFEPGQEHLTIDSRRVIGDASESAILKCMERLNQNVRDLRRHYPKTCELPFNSYDKYQLSIHETPNNDHYLLVIKGAPERILKLCNRILHIGDTVRLTEDILNKLHRRLYKYANNGERVLAFADLIITLGDLDRFNIELCNMPLKNLRFIGFITMMDPPRPSVPDAVAKCKHAGIRVIMITGDHPITATSIARQVGIISMTSKTKYDVASEKNKPVTELSEIDLDDCNTLVITGNELREMSSLELEAKLDNFNEILFARTSPQQKLKIVEALQQMQQIVAVTGDGVNDSPALKQANIGISMGIQGSDVSKDAADIVLLDDNFATIITAIEEGRLIFDNLKKSIAYLLTSNLPEIVPFIFMLTMDLPPIINVITVIVIDIGTDLWPAISLIYESAEADIMHRQPRNSKVDTLINRRLIFFTYAEIGMIQTFAGCVCYLCIMAVNGFYYDQLVGQHEWMLPNKIILDSLGRKWTYNQRILLTQQCYSGYFFTISITQVTDLLICKTRRLSLFRQGMSNWVLNFAIVFELCLTILLIYCPYINEAFQFAPVNVLFLLPALPFALAILLIDEIRKSIIRKYPDGLIAQETYY